MRSFSTVILTIGLSVVWQNLRSQDKIYMDSGLKLGKVLGVSATSITFKDLVQDTIITVDVSRVILLFNEKGYFLVPDKMDLRDSASAQMIKQFLDPQSGQFVLDRIYFISKKEIEDTISKEDDKYIYINHKGIEHQVDKRMIGAVVYRNGQYKFYHSVPKTADILLSCIQTSYAPSATVKTGKAAPVLSAANDAKKNDSSKLRFEDVAGKISKEEFRQKSYVKIHQFNSYLKILCDKTAGLDDQNNAVDQAVKLFVDDATIETSSVNSDAKGHFKVQEYLENLKNLRYDKIDITWTKVEYVSDIRVGADGKYYGAISFEQTFRGFRDGHLVYEDVTKKTAEVELKLYEKNYLGNIINQWDVLLSDIEVLTTKNL
jgi:hypothetical protein